MFYPPTNNIYGAHDEPMFRQIFQIKNHFLVIMVKLILLSILIQFECSLLRGQYPQYGIGRPTQDLIQYKMLILHKQLLLLSLPQSLLTLPYQSQLIQYLPSPRVRLVIFKEVK